MSWPTDRMSCGSLRLHDRHTWTGQTYGQQFHCPGVPPTFLERAARADRRLREENTRLTQDWREDA